MLRSDDRAPRTAPTASTRQLPASTLMGIIRVPCHAERKATGAVEYLAAGHSPEAKALVEPQRRARLPYIQAQPQFSRCGLMDEGAYEYGTDAASAKAFLHADRQFRGPVVQKERVARSRELSRPGCSDRLAVSLGDESKISRAPPSFEVMCDNSDRLGGSGAGLIRSHREELPQEIEVVLTGRSDYHYVLDNAASHAGKAAQAKSVWLDVTVAPWRA